MPNTNATTGIRFTVYSLNNDIDPDVSNDLWYGPQARDVTYEAALEEFRAAFVSEYKFYDRGDYDLDRDLADALYDFDPMIEEPRIEGEYEGVKYGISWLGGAPLLWVFESPHLGTFRLCSPCVPNACNGSNPDLDGYEGYAVPADWLYKEHHA